VHGARGRVLTRGVERAMREQGEGEGAWADTDEHEWAEDGPRLGESGRARGGWRGHWPKPTQPRGEVFPFPFHFFFYFSFLLYIYI
jgi:hypothetical protein